MKLKVFLLSYAIFGRVKRLYAYVKQIHQADFMRGNTF